MEKKNQSLVTCFEHREYPVGQHLKVISCCHPAGVTGSNVLTTAPFCNESLKHQPAFSLFHHKRISLLKAVYNRYNDGKQGIQDV